MKRWFARLPIHRKLVAVALAVTTVALMLATTGLVLIDVWRFRTTAGREHTSLADVLAATTSAAVYFSDRKAAQTSLATLNTRPSIRRACLYLASGELFASFVRSADLLCPATPVEPRAWTIVAGRAPVRQGDQTLGYIYVEGDLTELRARVLVAALGGLVMLVLAGGLAFALAYRLHRAISAPIASLAAAARTIGADGQPGQLPKVTAGEDEVGDLVRAFTEMLRRVREASRLKDEFLAAVSHELRTPLTAILGWAQILTTTPSDEEVRARAVASIARNARAQTRAIEDLVDVSRIVSGKLHLQLEPMDFKDAVEAALEVIRPAAQGKQLQLIVTLPATVCLVHGDRDRLQQVV